MALTLYDTATRSVRDFVPREPGKVGIYLCGLTVQSPPHIGHLRSGVNYDVLRRWLLRSGYAVRFVRNITDVDDKILDKAVEQARPFWEIAYENELALEAAYRALGVLPPTYEPRATGHVPQMHELIQRLIDLGHAYPAADGSGDVYFDVGSYERYGALSGQRPGQMQPCEDGPERAKRDPRDFALWKGAKSSEPADAAWPSPWGPGRPGWHIECSAMCWRYLGEEFDIHGGGLDLVFPHHENEVAQSKAAGFGFARYWVHHGLLNLGGTKMSKSIGNVLDMPHVTALGIRPVELRYYLATPHYRSVIDYSESSLREAAVAYQRIEGFVRRAAERLNMLAGETAAMATTAPGPATAAAVHPAAGPAGDPSAAPVCADFAEAMDDDLNTSQAMAAVHDVVRAGNAALADGNDRSVAGTFASVRSMLDVLGLDPLAPQWSSDGPEELSATVDALVALALEQRAQARSRRDWAAADAVRDQLKRAGVVVEDTVHGPRWTVGGGGRAAD